MALLATGGADSDRAGSAAAGGGGAAAGGGGTSAGQAARASGKAKRGAVLFTDKTLVPSRAPREPSAIERLQRVEDGVGDLACARL
jgi:hypothetical protein